MKYLNTMIGFREFPDEISLLINITGCCWHCPGCHSPELRKDIGIELTKQELARLIESNKGITLVGFMGGDSNPALINTYAAFVVCNYKGLKVGWYSGRNALPKEIDTDWFDYIKFGPYRKELGGLDNPNTNQIMFKVTKGHTGMGILPLLDDITYKFWKHGE